MASLLHSESRRKYSWWWDSHISPKNSKWLQENLTDMDAKVKSMIKLIEEDADSFARRAEMYYKKRPELMKLVEDFYRAYRALAERYDHATVELRHAHRTMAEAFPNQVPYDLVDDSASVSGPDGEAHTLELPAFIHQDDSNESSRLSSPNLHVSGDFSDESDSGLSKMGLKQLNNMFGQKGASKVGEGKMRKGLWKFHEATEGDLGGQAEIEVQALKKALDQIRAEKEDLVSQYQMSLEKLSNLEKELKEAGGLGERASRAEIEIKILKETLVKLESERDAAFLQYNECLQRISILEDLNAQTKEDARESEERANNVEMEAQNLKKELAELQSEKEAVLAQYNQCLEMISCLENKICLAEENSKMLNERIEKAEADITALKQALAKLREEKEAADLRYENCLEMITKLESENFLAQEDIKRLNNEILTAAEKLKSALENNFLLEKSNQSLKLESETLSEKIAIKDQQLAEKENELHKLQVSVQDKQSRILHVEDTLQSLQKLHTESQEERETLAQELQNRLQSLQELETCNYNLQEDLQRVEGENKNLNDLNSSSSILIKNLQTEVSSLKEIKEKLEEDVARQVDQSNALQQEICWLKEEIAALNRKYQALIDQIQAVGLSPESFSSSVKDLRDENLKLREDCRKTKDEKEVLYEKLMEMNTLLQNSVALEMSLSELNSKLENSTEKCKELQNTCQSLEGEKSGLVAEKSILLSQLQIMTENMQKLLEKKASLENSLSSANVELVGLRTKAKSLEDFCEMLKSDKINLQSEKSTLVSQLENVQRRLDVLERRFSNLEEKYINLDKERQSTICQMKELWGYLGAEKQEHSSYINSSNSRLAHLENQVHQLQEEQKLNKKEFEDELDKAVNAHVEIFILQKFIKDLEQKNQSLLTECQKHTEASKFSNKLIAELEAENLEQQVEVEYLMDKIEKLRNGFNQVFMALQFNPVKLPKDAIKEEQVSLAHVLDDVEGLKSALVENEDEKQRLKVENSVILSLLKQLNVEGSELESEKRILEEELNVVMKQHELLQKDEHELLEVNVQLNLELADEKQQREVLKAQLDSQHLDFSMLQGSYLSLLEENHKVIGQNESLYQQFSDLKKEMHTLEEENNDLLLEAVSLGAESVAFRSFGTEKASELKVLSEDFNRLQMINSSLKKKVEMLEEKLKSKEAESQLLNETVERFMMELHESNALNAQLNVQASVETEFLRQKAAELLQAEQMLKVVYNLNAEYSSTIMELKMEYEESKTASDIMQQQVLELTQDRVQRKKEIEGLYKENKSLESEVSMLQKEVEEQRTKEEQLSLELEEKNNEFKLWEVEASSFYFGFQTSSVHEVLLQNKVRELASVCETLEAENSTKDAEIKQMKQRLCFLETELGGVKTQLSAYIPVIATLRQDIESFEHNTLLRTKMLAGLETARKSHESSHLEGINIKDTVPADGIADLLKLQAKIKAVEKAVVDEMDRIASKNSVIEAVDAKQNTGSNYKKKKLKIKSEDAERTEAEINEEKLFEMRNVLLTKDIPLDQITDRTLYRRSVGERSASGDQMLELWESAEQYQGIDPTANGIHGSISKGNVTASHPSKSSKKKSRSSSLEIQHEKEVSIDRIEVSTSGVIRDPNQEGNRRKILERLASDAQTLFSLETMIQDLKKQLETKKRGKKANNLEIEKVKKQLLQVEETVGQLVNTNVKLTRDTAEELLPSFEESSNSISFDETDDIRNKRVVEQARKASEKLGRLQFELKTIEYMLLKLEDEKKSKSKHRFPGSKTGIILRDFIYNGRRSSRRRKKGCFCGCSRPSTNED